MELSIFKSRLEEVISELEKQADKLHDEFIIPEPCDDVVETYSEYDWYNFINTVCNQINKVDDKLNDIYKFIVQEDVHEREYEEIETPTSEFGRQLQKISDKIDHIYALTQDIHSSLMGNLYTSKDEDIKNSSGYDRHFDIIVRDAMNALYALKSINTFVFNLPTDADSCTCDKKCGCYKD